MSDIPVDATTKSEASLASTMMVQITNDKSGPKLVCPICNKALMSLNGYIKHLQKHEPPGGFCCNYCEECFCLEDLLKKHKDEKHKILACQICHETFTTPQDYRTHIKDIHKGVDRLMSVCEKCGVEFKTPQAAKRHKDTQCGQIKPHPCDECDIAFYTKYNLAEHKKIHRGEKKFCCSYCGKSFLNNGRLVIHERSHTGEKPYKCDVCGKCFAHRESIVTHSSIHTGVKLVVCKHCGARFSCHSNLIKHRRTRPDTCGLPIYDSTKETKRNRTSRIPASLMSSEIKIVRASKVINPNQEQKKPKAPTSNVPKPKKSLDPKLDSAEDENIIKQLKLSQTTAESVNLMTSNVDAIATPIRAYESDDNHDDLPFENSMDSDNSNQGEEFKPTTANEPIVDTSVKEIKQTPVEADPFTKKAKILDNIPPTEDTAIKNESFPEVDGVLPKPNENNNIPIKSCRVILTRIEKVLSSPNPQTNKTKTPTLKRHRSALRKKLHIFKRDRIYECKFCVKVYHIRKPYEKHLRDYHMKTEEEIRSIFKEEENDIPPELIYRCPICSKVYLMEKRLKTHITFHGPDGSLIHKCPSYCNIYFKSKEEAMEHAKIVHKLALFCEICDKFSPSPEALKIHRRTHFERRKQMDRNLICDKCAKSFASRTSLNDHTRSNCGKNPLYRCDICEKRFSTAGILKTHTLLHKDETPFVCDKCGKAFKIQSQYKTHLKYKHTNDKPFKCNLCPKQYPYRESLLTHMAIHTGLKRYACNGCSKRFTCISNLQSHRKVYADTCGLQPLNSKPSQYIGMQKGLLVIGTKPSF